MSDPRQTINLEGYLRNRRAIYNESGGRGYEKGVRVFDCPLCRDTKHRGWMNVYYWAAGCFNMGCVANKEGFGSVEWIRRVEGKVTRSEVWRYMRAEWGLAGAVALRPPTPVLGPDFVRWPEGARAFQITGSELQDEFVRFALKQWSIGVTDCQEWGLYWTPMGAYAWRIIIPINLGGKPVSFQARSIRGAEPKYRTAKYGDPEDPKAECARPLGEVFFNYDSLPVESEAMLVEGPGDVMAWHRGNPRRTPHALALMGQALTPTRLALLKARRVQRVVVALDAERETEVHASELCEDLLSWGLEPALGTWDGGKDPGQGASLRVQDATPGDLGSLQALLRRL